MLDRSSSRIRILFVQFLPNLITISFSVKNRTKNKLALAFLLLQDDDRDQNANCTKLEGKRRELRRRKFTKKVDRLNTNGGLSLINII